MDLPKPMIEIRVELVDSHEDVPFADGSDHSNKSANSDEEADKVAEDGICRNAPEPGALTAKFKRRNSISLPAGLDALAAVPEGLEQASDGESNSQGSSTDDEASYSGSDDENYAAKVPLRNARKKSVMPLPKLRLNDSKLSPDDEFDTRGFGGMESPANSVTSINSLSSLLKEKLVMTFPGVLRRKRPREYKLKAFVGILFLCIVFLVGFAYVFYHQQVLQRAYFERIRFNKDERQMKIYSADGHELISGELGVGLGGHSYPCLAKDNPGNGSVCLEWMRYARLVMRYDAFDDEVRCYHINWQALSHQHHPTDCFDWSLGKGHWFGGGLAAGAAWPLEDGFIRMAPFVTGTIPEHAWANVLQRYFLNSKGVAIIVHENSPLYVESTASKKFCIKARHDDFAYVYHKTDMPLLNYSICTAPDVKQLHSFLAENSLWDGIKESDLEAINALLLEPVWQISANSPDMLTEQEVANLTEEVVSFGYPAGPVLLNEMWQTSVGDLALDETRFPTFKDTVDIIHRRGFRIVLTVQPFISTESASFYEAVRESLLVNERGGEIPALTRYKNILSAGVLDITKNHSTVWIQQKLKSLQTQYGVDAFYLDMGSANDMPHYYQFDQELTNPDQYKTLFTKRVLQSVSVLGVSGAVKRPQPPIFVSLPPFASDWRSLKDIIPAVLTYGIVGYPFLLAGPVGGDCEIASSLPERELYIRWMQLAAFLPTMSFRHLPSKYDSEVEKIAKGLLELRRTLVNPLLAKSVDEALNYGIPFARPLWMLEPLGQAAQSVNDEFSISDQIIVAPVLQQNSDEREIYLPNGVWKDGIDGSLRKGNRWIHHYKVPLDKVAYFVRMPNNTRF